MASISQASTTNGSFLLTISKVICFFVQEACHVRGFKKLQCLSMLAAATAQRPLDFQSEFLATLAMCFSLLFSAPTH